MFRPRVLALAAIFALCGVFFVNAQEDADARAILKKAIAAHGGAELLAKNKAGISKFKGTMDLMGNEVAIAGESMFCIPDKFKNTANLEVNGMNIQFVAVFNGKQMWVSAAGNTMEITDEKALAEMRFSVQAEGGAGRLIQFLEKPYELNVIGETKVKDKDAIGVRVSKKDQRDISLFFDKKTHLLIKTEMRVNEMGAGQEVTQEKYVSEYHKHDSGAQVPGKLAIYKDGKKFMELEISESKLLESLGDDSFQMP